MQKFSKPKIFTFLFVGILSMNIAYSQNVAVLTGDIDSNGIIINVNSNMGFAAKTVIKNNSYEFVIPAGQQWDVYTVDYHKKGGFNLPVLLKAGSKLHISVNKTLDKFTMTGDKNAEEQNSFWQGLLTLFKDYPAIQKKIIETKDSAEISQLKKKLEFLDSQGKKYYRDWVVEHISSPFSCLVIRSYIDVTNIKRAEDTVAEHYYDMLTPAAKENNYQAIILQREFAHYNPKYSNNQVGNVISKEIVVKDTLGNTISLSDCKGKYVLIDFWASWCGPCRENNPNLTILYNKFHDKGLDIFSMSADTDQAKWKAAIAKDNMKWLNGSDLKGVDKGIAADFQIVAIPRYILISSDKRIILNGDGIIEDVENKLNELLGSSK